MQDEDPIKKDEIKPKLGELEHFPLEWRCRILHVVGEIKVEKEEMVLSCNRGTHSPVAEHSVRKVPGQAVCASGRFLFILLLL